jgi:septal ring factor EnvC (AmiA/AmiB activator)
MASAFPISSRLTRARPSNFSPLRQHLRLERLQARGRCCSTVPQYERPARIERLTAQIGSLVEANTTRIAQLVDVCLSLARHAEESDRRMQAGFDELRGIQAASEYKLKALIETVDKIVQRDGDTSA